MSEGSELGQRQPPPLRWPTDHPPTGHRPSRRPPRAALVVPALMWIIGTPVCLLYALSRSLTLFGQPASEENARAVTVALVLAGVCCLAAPVVGLVLAHRAGSSGGKWLYAIATGLGVLPFVGMVALLSTHGSDLQPTEPAPWVCQEHSGGDNSCPGE